MSERREPGRRRRAVLAASAALVVAAALAAGSAWLRRESLAAWWLERWLAARGVEPATLRVAGLGVAGIELADVAIGPPAAPDLAVARLAARWSPRGLLAGRFDALEIAGARLRGTVGAAGLGFGAADPLLGGGGTPGGAPALPAPAIGVRDARVDIGTPRGHLEGGIEGSLSAAPEGAVQGEFVLVLSHPLADASGTLRLSGRTDDLAGELELLPRVDVPGLHLGAGLRPRATLRLRGGRLDATLAAPPVPFAWTRDGVTAKGETPELSAAFGVAPDRPLALHAGIEGGRVDLASGTLRLHGLGVVGRLEGPLEDAAFDLALSAEEGRVRLEASGRADLRARTGRAELRGAPLAFAPDGLQPAALSPALARAEIRGVTGSVEVRGRAARTSDGLGGALDVALRDLAFAHPLGRVEGLHGAVALRGPPLHTPEGQLVSIARIDPGIPLTDGLLEFRLGEDGVLALRRATWHLAGGELRAGDARLDLAAGRGELALEVRDVELAALLEQVRLPGLEGSGRIDGRLPLALAAGALSVHAGELRAAGAGTLRYRPDKRARALAAARPADLGIAVAAFSDFRYDRLEARLDGELRGAMQIALHVRGANPTFQDGRPVELHLDLEARLADLVRAGLASYRIPEAVEERLRAFSEGKTP